MEASNPPLMESTIIKFSADFFAPESEHTRLLFAAKIISKLSLSVNRERILIKKNDKSRHCTDYSEALLISPCDSINHRTDTIPLILDATDLSN